MNSEKIICSFLIGLLTSASALAAEKSSKAKKSKEAAEHHRGWIGGEYKLAKRNWSWFSTSDAVFAFPKSLTNTYKGLVITRLSTNTPAYLAGLREADLLLELNGEKTTSLSRFREKIDRAQPGASLHIGAFRDGELRECNVTVGCETFREQGMFAIGLPFGLPATNLKFNPSFSLIALGFSSETNKRIELNSGEQIFQRQNSKEYYPGDVCWRAWLGPFTAMHTREIRSQEIVAR
jgi:hypothetical protein